MSNARFGLRVRSGLIRNILGGNSSYGYVLNDFPNSIGGYSLRLLNENYTGYAIRVRRSSDNTELDIGFLGYEMDLLTLQSFCTGVNCFVTRWYDQSLTTNLIQTSLVSQPIIISGGTLLTVANKPAIFFDGIDDFFPIPNIASQSRLDSYWVTKPDDNSYLFLGSLLNSNLWSWVVTSSDTSSFLTGNYGSGSIYNRGNLFTGTNRGQLFVFLDGHNLIVHQNASTSDVSWAGAVLFRYPTTASFNFKGYSQEIVLYNFDQSSNRVNIQNNINSYYNIY